MTQTHLHELLRKVALDDDIAFKAIFFHYRQPLLAFCRSFVKSTEAAEEIVADVFVNLWKKRTELPAVNDMKVYLYVITKNLSINYLNRQYNANIQSMDVLEVACTPLVATPEDITLGNEMLQRINTAVNALPPKCKMVYKLVKEDGMRYRQVAEILDISERTIENHIAAALKKIAAAICANRYTAHNNTAHIRN